MTSTPGAGDDLVSEVDSLYVQHLKMKLRNARRHLAATVDQLTRTPDNPQLNTQVDEASREVALIDRELAVYRAKNKEYPLPPGNAPGVNEATPSETFRAAQLAKAAQAIRAVTASPSADTDRRAPTASSPLPPAVELKVDVARPAAPVIPPQAMAPAAPTKTCPQCGSRVVIEAGRCHCGHSFLSDPGIASDEFLTREEVLALRRGTKQPT